MNQSINQEAASDYSFPLTKEQAKRFVASHPNLLRDVARILDIRDSAVSHHIRGRITSARIDKTIKQLEPLYRRNGKAKVSPRQKETVPDGRD